MAEPLGRHVALLGLMGSGKTAVGTQLAIALGVRFDDNDSRLAAVSGLTPRELPNRDGIVALHSLEAKHFLGALRSPTPGVVSGAASVVEDSSCREALRNPEICAIWLRVEPATLFRPVSQERGTARSTRTTCRVSSSNQLAARAPLYQQVSNSVIDTDGLTVAEVVEPRAADRRSASRHRVAAGLIASRSEADVPPRTLLAGPPTYAEGCHVPVQRSLLIIRYRTGSRARPATSCGRRRSRPSLLSALGLLDRACELDA